MNWNYRLIDRSHFNDGDPWVEIVEAYYDEEGKLKGFSSPCVNGENKDEIVSALKMILADIEDKPVLTLADFGMNEENDKPEWKDR